MTHCCQASLSMFTATYDAFWAAARTALGDAVGTQALIEVLLHRHLEHADVLSGITAALTVGSVDVDVVAVEARSSRPTEDVRVGR